MVIDSFTALFIILILLKIKHFICDYICQTPYMLGKFKPDWDFIPPLMAHVGTHGIFTFLLCWWINPTVWWLAFVDMASHFIIDRVKAGPKYLGRYKALDGDGFKRAFDTIQHATDPKAIKNAETKIKHNTYFWWSLGFDQMWHGISDLVILYAIFTMV